MQSQSHSTLRFNFPFPFQFAFRFWLFHFASGNCLCLLLLFSFWFCYICHWLNGENGPDVETILRGWLWILWLWCENRKWRWRLWRRWCWGRRGCECRGRWRSCCGCRASHILHNFIIWPTCIICNRCSQAFVWGAINFCEFVIHSEPLKTVLVLYTFTQNLATLSINSTTYLWKTLPLVFPPNDTNNQQYPGNQGMHQELTDGLDGARDRTHSLTMQRMSA